MIHKGSIFLQSMTVSGNHTIYYVDLGLLGIIVSYESQLSKKHIFTGDHCISHRKILCKG